MADKPISEAIAEFIEAKQAERRSENTLNDYRNTFRKFKAFLAPEDPLMDSITPRDIRQFLGQMANVSKKTVKNAHGALSSLWNWAAREGICRANILALVDSPRPEKRTITPYLESEVASMVEATVRSLPYVRPGKRPCDNGLLTPLRDGTIILTLVDTGIRASELCDVRIRDISEEGMLVFGKGDKERIVPLSDNTRAAIDEYLKNERPVARPAEPLFRGPLSRKKLDRGMLLRLIRRIARRAGVGRANVHRFRHTFAITFLRNGGDVYSLQATLGHTTMDMVKKYLLIAQTDVAKAHRKASPVKNWRLGLPPRRRKKAE